MKTFQKLSTLSLILAVMFLASCDVIQQQDQPSTGTGKVVLKLTDAPFPADQVASVDVVVDTVWLRIAGGECSGVNGEAIGEEDSDTAEGKDKNKDKNKGKGFDYSSFDCESGFVKLAYSAENLLEFDLMQLQNGITLDLEATIPVGEYDMIKLRIVEATITLKEENEKGEKSFNLKVPSGNTSGLKLLLDPILVVSEEDVAEVVVDFDLSRSFIAQGNPKNKHGIHGFIFKPVLRAVNNKHAGSIYGKITDAENKLIAGATITVKQGETVVTSALSNEDGFYKVIGLPAGTYSILVEAEGFDDKTIIDIVVPEKGKVKKDVQLTKTVQP